MKIQGEHVFKAPRETVWHAVLSPKVLASSMPGLERLHVIGDNEYEGALAIKVGAVEGDFQGTLELDNLNPPSSYRIRLRGMGGAGLVDGEGMLALEEAGAGTRLHYELEAKISGHIAGVEQHLVESSARILADQTLKGIGRQIASADLTPEPAGVVWESPMAENPAIPASESDELDLDLGFDEAVDPQGILDPEEPFLQDHDVAEVEEPAPEPVDEPIEEVIEELVVEELIEEDPVEEATPEEASPELEESRKLKELAEAIEAIQSEGVEPAAIAASAQKQGNPTDSPAKPVPYPKPKTPKPSRYKITTQVARGFLSDLASDLVPKERRPLVFTIGAAIYTLIVVLITRACSG